VRAAAAHAERLNPPTAGRLWNSLGYYLQALADYAGARAAYERALRIKEAIYEPNHPSIATTVNNLGGVLQALGETAGARAAFERALRIWEQTLPQDHPHIRIVRSNLASLDEDTKKE